jgi:ribosome-binding factor A
METTRQNKLARLIQKQLAEFYQIETKDLYEGALITVTKVYITKDLSLARIYLSLFTTGNKNELLTRIRQHGRETRRYIGNRLRNQLRVIPELEFHIDDSLDYIDHIESLLHS